MIYNMIMSIFQSGELLRVMKGDTVGSTNLHLAYNDRLLVGAVNADLEINDYSTRKGVTNRKLQVNQHCQAITDSVQRFSFLIVPADEN